MFYICNFENEMWVQVDDDKSIWSHDACVLLYVPVVIHPVVILAIIRKLFFIYTQKKVHIYPMYSCLAKLPVHAHCLCVLPFLNAKKSHRVM